MDQNLFDIILMMVCFLFALSFHESAHAYTAFVLGDSYAAEQGRISLNPLVHMDLVGTVIMPILMAVTGVPLFGWAKPVPVTGQGFRNPTRDHFLVAIAGPVSNLLLAAAGTIVYVVLMVLVLRLDFLGAAFGGTTAEFLMRLFRNFLLINLILAIFNMIPVPPLDGSWVAEYLLPVEMREGYRRLRPYGFIILMGLVVTGLVGVLIIPPLRTGYALFAGLADGLVGLLT